MPRRDQMKITVYPFYGPLGHLGVNPVVLSGDVHQAELFRYMRQLIGRVLQALSLK